MNVLIQISFISNDNNVLQRGTFPLKGQSKEMVSLDFWKWIKREHPFGCEMEKVVVDGEDITEKVKELEKAPLD